MSVFSDRLRHARLAIGITQQEAICRVEGLKGRREKWSRWENGHLKPRCRDITAVAQAVNSTPKDLTYFDRSHVWCYSGECDEYDDEYGDE